MHNSGLARQRGPHAQAVQQIPSDHLDFDLVSLDRGYVVSPEQSETVRFVTGVVSKRSLFLAPCGLLRATSLQACAGEKHFAPSAALANGKIKFATSRG
jgi:hypothetical protein